ncbi:unnamed protein product [Brugia timori]|uniref:Peptidase_M48 domain-containing protein n=1 Tax=Brugia timori TaxID=42155 RepID=A0A0R3RB63_9BILA|nr:unnamed protein product [Brugia timori]
MEYPKQSNMNIMFNESMNMPNITFCMAKQQAWSHLPLNNSELADEWDRRIQQTELEKLNSREKFLEEAWDYRLVLEAYEVIATLNSMERETTAQGSARSINFFSTHPKLQAKRTMITWLNEIKQRGVTFEELTQKIGSETIKYSLRRFQRTTFNESLKIKTKFRTSWISTMQFCFQPWFDRDNYFEIKDQVLSLISLLSSS